MMIGMRLSPIVLRSLRISFFVSEHRHREGVYIPTLSHGNRIVEIVIGTEDLRDCDALITRRRDVQLGITTADCAPICFSDGEVFGIAHVGWRGLTEGLVPKMLSHFRDETLEVYVGPHLHSFAIKRDDCYVRIESSLGSRFFERRDEKIVFNFSDALRATLPATAQWDPRETGPQSGLPSHRHNGTSERIITVVQSPNETHGY